jgi:hypothetical protein
MIAHTLKMDPTTATPGLVHVVVGTATATLMLAVMANGIIRRIRPSPTKGPFTASTMCTVRGAVSSTALSPLIDRPPHVRTPFV